MFTTHPTRRLFAGCAALCVFSLDPEWVARLCANFRHSVHNPHGLGIGNSLIDDALLTQHAKLIAGRNYQAILVATRVLLLPFARRHASRRPSRALDSPTPFSA